MKIKLPLTLYCIITVFTLSAHEKVKSKIDAYGQLLRTTSELPLNDGAFRKAHPLVDITNLGGTISDQFEDSPPNEDATKAIDNSPATKYSTWGRRTYLIFEADQDYVVSKYAITSAADSPEKDPSSWTLEASLNGLDWVELTYRENQFFSARNQRRVFTIRNTTSYRFFKLSLATTTASMIQIAELEYFGVHKISPVVEITSPKDGSYFTPGSTVTITASASDPDGSIRKVDFFAKRNNEDSNVLIGTDWFSPYSITRSNVPEGWYTVTARATDNEGVTTTSEVVNVYIDPVALVDITDLGGTITDQYNNSPDNEDASKAIDNDRDTKYNTFSSQTHLVFKANEAYVLREYSITSANDAPERDPSEWIIAGSVDGANWEDIQSMTGYFNRRLQRQSFWIPDNTTPYMYYRLSIINNGGDMTQIAEWELLAVPNQSEAKGVAVSTDTTDITNLLGGIITAEYNNVLASQSVAMVIDDSVSTKYVALDKSAWIQFQAPSSYVVTQYSLTSANDSPDSDPYRWKLEGSNNGKNWRTIDERRNQDFSDRLQRREFTFTNSQAYTYYRLEMRNNDGRRLQLAEWELFGSPANTTKSSISEENISTETKFVVYPNPSAGIVNIKGVGLATSVQLIDFQGTVVRSWNGSTISDVDVYGIKPGIYSIKVTGKSGSYLQRLEIK